MKAEGELSGEVEVDGGYFGGHVKPENRKEDRKDRRLAMNQTGKRQVVVVMRERNGKTLPFVFRSEDESIPTINSRVAAGSVIHADEAPAWDSLHARYLTKRINHKRAYSESGACTNMAESYFSRLRRAEDRRASSHRWAVPWARMRRKWAGERITAARVMGSNICRWLERH